MPRRETNPDTTIKITRVYNAPRERVFKAFIDPDQLREWWCPEGFTFTNIIHDPESGLGTQYTMVDNESGDAYTWDMVWEEIDEPNRIQWISIWREGFPDKRETYITIDLREVEDGTELTLTHANFPDKDTRDAHAGGWGGILEKLATHIG